MKKLPSILFGSMLAALGLLTACASKNENEVTETSHDFTVENTEEKYLASAATCTKPARYYYSCSCGEKSTKTFAYGEAAGHDFNEDGTKCSHDGCNASISVIDNWEKDITFTDGWYYGEFTGSCGDFAFAFEHDEYEPYIIHEAISSFAVYEDMNMTKKIAGVSDFNYDEDNDEYWSAEGKIPAGTYYFALEIKESYSIEELTVEFHYSTTHSYYNTGICGSCGHEGNITYAAYQTIFTVAYDDRDPYFFVHIILTDAEKQAGKRITGFKLVVWGDAAVFVNGYVGESHIIRLWTDSYVFNIKDLSTSDVYLTFEMQYGSCSVDLTPTVE